eukprot:scaffold70044_cov24-Cyclotella_meneghiniana.AAC.1
MIQLDFKRHADLRPLHYHFGRLQLRRCCCNAAVCSLGSSLSGSGHELANTRSAAVCCFIDSSQEFQRAVGQDYGSRTVESKQFRLNNVRVKVVGVFESALHLPDDAGIQQYLVKRISERSQCDVELPAQIQAYFHRYLDANKPTDRNKTKQSEKEKKRKATGQNNNNNATPVKDADVDDDAIAMAAEMVAKATAIAAEMGELKRKISCGLDELIANRSRLIELEDKHISEDESAELALESLLYHHDGRPDDLKSGLLTDAEREVKIKQQCGDSNYYVHKKYNTWTPERADVFDSRSLSHKKKMAQAAQNLVDVFKREHLVIHETGVITATKRDDAIEEFDVVAAAGASDWAKQGILYSIELVCQRAFRRLPACLLKSNWIMNSDSTTQSTS